MYPYRNYEHHQVHQNRELVIVYDIQLVRLSAGNNFLMHCMVCFHTVDVILASRITQTRDVLTSTYSYPHSWYHQNSLNVLNCDNCRIIFRKIRSFIFLIRICHRNQKKKKKCQMKNVLICGS